MRDPGPTALLWGAPARGRLFDLQGRQYSALAEARTRLECRYVARFARGALVLDIGAGTGRVALPVAAGGLAEVVVAMDPAMAMLERLLARPDLPPGRIRAVVGMSLETLPFRDSVFDGAYCFGVVSRFEDWVAVLRPVGPALRPGARLVFNQKCADGLARWTRGVSARGAVRADALDGTLRSVGLGLEAAFPGSLLTVAVLYAAWGGEPSRYTPLVAFSVNRWIDALVGGVRAIDDWLEIETGLAALLPIDASTHAIVVARRPAQGGQDVQGGRDAGDGLSAPPPPPADALHGRIVDLLGRDRVRAALEDPACLRLLGLVSALLAAYCGGRNPVAAVRGGAEAVEAARAGMARARAPGAGAALRKAWHDGMVRARDTYHRGRERLGRP